MERLEPLGHGNPEPVFSARAVRLMAPPRILKDKHVKLKLAAAIAAVPEPDPAQLSEVAILATPRCHPDGAGILATIGDLPQLRSDRILRAEG